VWPFWQTNGAGEYQFGLRAKQRLELMVPIVSFVIFVLLYMMFHFVTEARALIFRTSLFLRFREPRPVRSNEAHCSAHCWRHAYIHYSRTYPSAKASYGARRIDRLLIIAKNTGTR
jgi:hypothetical protein